jgi:hypothetical protein
VFLRTVVSAERRNFLLSMTSLSFANVPEDVQQEIVSFLPLPTIFQCVAQNSFSTVIISQNRHPCVRPHFFSIGGLLDRNLLELRLKKFSFKQLRILWHGAFHNNESLTTFISRRFVKKDFPQPAKRRCLRPLLCYASSTWSMPTINSWVSTVQVVSVPSVGSLTARIFALCGLVPQLLCWSKRTRTSLSSPLPK